MNGGCLVWRSGDRGRICRDTPGVPPQGYRGTFDLQENRAAQAGRTIGLNVVVVVATGKEPAPAARFHISDGSGLLNEAVRPQIPWIAHR